MLIHSKSHQESTESAATVRQEADNEDIIIGNLRDEVCRTMRNL